MSIETPESNKLIRVFCKGSTSYSCIGMFVEYRPRAKKIFKGARFCRRTLYGKYEAEPEIWKEAISWEYIDV